MLLFQLVGKKGGNSEILSEPVVRLFAKYGDELAVGLETRQTFIDPSQLRRYELEFGSNGKKGESSLHTFFTNMFGAWAIEAPRGIFGPVSNFVQQYTHNGKLSAGEEIVLGKSHYKVVETSTFPMSITLSDGHFLYYVKDGQDVVQKSIDPKIIPPIERQIGLRVDFIEEAGAVQMLFFPQWGALSGGMIALGESAVMPLTNTQISLHKRVSGGNDEYYWKLQNIQYLYDDYHDEHLVRMLSGYGVTDVQIGAPYPNPLQRGDMIAVPIKLPFGANDIHLILYNELGSEVKRVPAISSPSNEFEVFFHLNEVANGAYFATLSVAYFNENGKWGEAKLVNNEGKIPIGKIVVANK